MWKGMKANNMKNESSEALKAPTKQGKGERGVI